LIGAFAKLRKAANRFIMCVSPSVRPHGKIGLIGWIFMKFDSYNKNKKRANFKIIYFYSQSII